MVAVPLIVVFVLLSLLHWHWVFGGTFGITAAVPEVAGKRAFSPGPLATSLVALALLGAAFVCAAQAGIAGLPSTSYTRIGVIVLAALFALRAIGDFRFAGFFKRVRGTRFARWDTRLFSPLCLAISAMCVGLLLGAG